MLSQLAKLAMALRPVHGAVPQRAFVVTFRTGDFTSYTADEWAAPADDAGQLLNARYEAVYAASGGVMRAGAADAAGCAITFTSADQVLAYLPDNRPSGALGSNYTNPDFTSAGAFASDLVALKLDVDFADFGFLPGVNGVRFGDLMIGEDRSGLRSLGPGHALNARFFGLTIRQFLALANQALAGIIPFSAEFARTATLLSESFGSGFPRNTAQRQLCFPNSAGGADGSQGWLQQVAGFGPDDELTGVIDPRKLA